LPSLSTHIGDISENCAHRKDVNRSCIYEQKPCLLHREQRGLNRKGDIAAILNTKKQNKTKKKTERLADLKYLLHGFQMKSWFL